jgi:hypothetical protein
MKPRRPVKKSNNRNKYIAAGGGALLLLIVAVIYFLSSGSRASEDEGSAAPAAATPKAAAPAKILTEAESEALLAGQSLAPGKAPKGAISSEEDRSSPSPARVKAEFPVDFAKWKPEHFRLAREKRSPRIVQAVRQLGRGNDANPDANENAHLLAELLTPSSDPTKLATDESTDSEGANTSIPGLGPAIVDTLAVNGSEEARATLKRILLGKQPSDSPDRVITIAALRAIVNHPDEQNQRILTVLLAVPETVRPAGRGEVTADQLQDECLKLIKPVATADFRLDLAKKINQGNSSASSRRRVIAMLTSGDPANRSAQIELLVNGQLEPSMISRLDAQLGPTAQQVLEALQRATPTDWATLETDTSIPPIPPPNADENSREEITLNDAVRFAKQLWRPDFIQEMVARVDSDEITLANSPLLTLAAAIPSDTVRKSLLRKLAEFSADDDTAPQFSSLFSDEGYDPGWLVVLKQLPREEPKASSGKTSAKPGNATKDLTVAQLSTKEQSTRRLWLKTSEKFLRGVIDRLSKTDNYRSGSVNAVAGQRLDPVESSEEFDSLLEAPTPAKKPVAAKAHRRDSPPDVDVGISLHEGAEVKNACILNWPADFRGGLQSLASGQLLVRYVRLTSESDIDTVARFYQNQLKTSLLRTVSRGRWVDSLTKLDDGQVRSLDVLITRTGTGPSPPHGTPEKIIVDILSVQIPDPQEQPTKDDMAVSSVSNHQ